MSNIERYDSNELPPEVCEWADQWGVVEWLQSDCLLSVPYPDKKITPQNFTASTSYMRYRIDERKFDRNIKFKFDIVLDMADSILLNHNIPLRKIKEDQNLAYISNHPNFGRILIISKDKILADNFRTVFKKPNCVLTAFKHEAGYRLLEDSKK